MIIDFHCHIYPAKIAEKASKSVGDFYNYPMKYHGSPEELLESGSKIGVSKYVILPVATKAMQVEPSNNFTIEQCEEHPEFIGFGTMHPDYDNYEAELHRIKAAGLRGIKLHSDFQKFQIDAARMDSVYDIMTDLEMPLIMHAGDYRYDFSGPQRILNLHKKHPKLTLIAAHFGGYTEWEESMKWLVGEDVYFDTSSTLEWLPLEKANEMIRKHGVEKFLFASDFPMWDHEEELERFMKLDLTNEERDMIFHKNAERLLGLSISLTVNSFYYKIYLLTLKSFLDME